MSKRRVVVTGTGLVTPLGVTEAETWQALLAGKSGVRTIDFFDASGLKTRFGGIVRPFDMEPRRTVHSPFPIGYRWVRFALEATRQAFVSAGLERWTGDRGRFGMSFAGSEYHFTPEQYGPWFAQAFDGERYSHARLCREVIEAVEPEEILFHESHHLTALLTAQYETEGPALSALSSCAASAQAVGEAFRMIRRGDVDLCMAGGAETSLSATMIIFFSLLGVLSQQNDAPERASKPFDRMRNGFVIGEGGGALVLEELDHARARGARILGEIVGYGSYQEAYHVTGASPEATGAAEAIRKAVTDAGIEPSDIGYVNAHGTSTIDNDAAETKAIKRVFGDAAYRIPVSSTKSSMGHLVSGAGAVEAVITLLALRDQMAPPTINLEIPDPDCDLDYVPNAARGISARYAMSNSFGFGGQNATLVFRRWEEEA